MGPVGGVLSGPGTAHYLRHSLQHWDEFGFGAWIYFAGEGELIGYAGLRHMDLSAESDVEIFCVIRRTRWRRGFGTEITAKLVEIALEQLGLRYCVALVAPKHLASRRVLEKNGFIEVGTVQREQSRKMMYRIDLERYLATKVALTAATSDAPTPAAHGQRVVSP